MMAIAGRRTRVRLAIERESSILGEVCRSYGPYRFDSDCDISGYSSRLSLPGIVRLSAGFNDGTAPQNVFVVSRMIRTDLGSNDTWHASVSSEFVIPSKVDLKGSSIRGNLEVVPVECDKSACADLGRAPDVETFRLDVDWDAMRHSLETKGKAIDDARLRLREPLLALADGAAVDVRADGPRILAPTEGASIVIPVRVRVDEERHRALLGKLSAALAAIVAPSAQFHCRLPTEQEPYSRARRTPLPPFGSIEFSCFSDAYAALREKASESFYMLMLPDSVSLSGGINGIAYAVPVGAIDAETHLRLSGATTFSRMRVQLRSGDGSVITEQCTSFDGSSFQRDSNEINTECDDTPLNG